MVTGLGNCCPAVGEGKMRNILFGAVGAIALGISVPASAADLAARPYTKAPPMMAVAYDWSGFYVGLNGGGGSSHDCWSFLAPGGLVMPEGCHNATGGTVGGQIGYRWQASSWVFGVEAQGNWADFSGDNLSTVFGGGGLDTRNRSRIDAFGLFTGQVGYTWNNVLLYVKGGAAVVDNRFDIFAAPGNVFVTPGSLIGSASETRWGGTVGAGLEVGFAPNWSVGVEYDHIFLDSQDITFTPGRIVPGGDRIGQDVDMGLVRLNYRWGGPVIAKY
jgi:outer membrane immunogenic protein